MIFDLLSPVASLAFVRVSIIRDSNFFASTADFLKRRVEEADGDDFRRSLDFATLFRADSCSNARESSVGANAIRPSFSSESNASVLVEEVMYCFTCVVISEKYRNFFFITKEFSKVSTYLPRY